MKACVVRNDNLTPLKNEFKGKLIYAQTGSGKTTIADNVNVIDGDTIIANILETDVSNISNKMKSLSTNDKILASKLYEDNINKLLEQGKTVITARVKSIQDADYVIYNPNEKEVSKRTSSNRVNKYLDRQYVQQGINVVESYLKQNPNKKSITLSDNQYLSDVLLTDSSYKMPSFYTKQKIKKNNKRLDKQLISFVSNFGVDVEEFSDLKDRLGVDALGATDIMNKVIWLSDNREIDTVPEEVAHMIVMLLGNTSRDIKSLYINVEKWSKYKEIYNEYMPIYNNVQKVKVEAIGKMLSEAIVQEWEYNNQPIIEKNLFKTMRNLVDRFLNKLQSLLYYKTDIEYYQNIPYEYSHESAVKLARQILDGQTQIVDQTIPKNRIKLSYQNAVKNSPKIAKYVIDLFSKKDFKYRITGSLAVAKQGDIYRNKNEQIHDVDFVAGGSTTDLENLNKYIDNINGINIHNGIQSDEFITYSYYVPLPGYTIENVVRNEFGGIDEFDLYHKGNVISKKEVSNYMMAVDFFWYDNIPTERFTDDNVVTWQSVMEGKLAMSYYKSSAVLFNRAKDQKDYNLFNPDTKAVPFKNPKHIYYQLPSQNIEVTIDGKPSKLYENLNSQLGDSELALQAWAKTQTNEFQEWFGDSAVVDENGEPKIVYAQTTENDNDALMFFSEEKNDKPHYLNVSEIQEQDGKIVVDNFDNTKAVFNDNLFDFENDNDFFYDPVGTDEHYENLADAFVSDYSKMLYFKKQQLSLLKNRLAKVTAARKEVDKINDPTRREKARKALVKLQAQLEKRIGYSTKDSGTGLENEVEILSDENRASIMAVQTFAENDFNRLDAVMKSNNIHDIKEAAQIINFYKKMYPQEGVEHPLFTKSELFHENGSSKLSDEVLAYYKELADKAIKAENQLNIKQKKAVENMVNNNVGVKQISKGEDLAYSTIISQDTGLHDLGWFDMMFMDINTGILSQNGILPQVMFASLQDSINTNMAQAEVMQEKLDAMQEDVEKVLRDEYKQGTGIIGSKGVSYDMFKQVDENGFETGRIVHRYSSAFYNARRSMNNTFKSMLKDAKAIENPVDRAQKLHEAFEWRRHWYRENTVQMQLGLLPEIMNDARFAQFSKHFNPEKSAEHVAQLKELLGEKGYQEEIAKQVKALEKYIHDREAYAEIMTDKQMEKFDLEHSPFIGNEYFNTSNEYKHYNSPVRPNMKYNISIPRKKRGDVKYNADTETYTITDSNEDLSFFDNKYKEIEKNDTLYKYHNLLIEVNKKIRDGLPIEVQDELQVNSIPAVEKSITELLLEASTPFDKLKVFGKFWQRMKEKITVGIQNDLSHAEKDPLTGKANYKVNDSFFSQNKKKISLMNQIELKRVAQAMGMNYIDPNLSIGRSAVIRNPRLVALFSEYLGVESSPEAVYNALQETIIIKDFVYGAVTHKVAQDNSFDLPKVMKLYLDVSSKFKAKNDILPILEVLKKHYEDIKSPMVNNVGVTMKNARAGYTELEGNRVKAIAQMDDWFNRVVLDHHGIQHAGVLSTVKDFIGDEKVKSKRWIDRISAITTGTIKPYYNKEEKQLLAKLEDVISKEEDANERARLQQIAKSLGRSYTLTSIFDGILSFVRFKNLGFNLSSSMTNLMEGETSNLILASLGDFYSEDQYWRANAIARKSIKKNLTKGMWAHPDAKKLRVLMDKTQILQDSSNELQRSSVKSAYSKIGNLIGPFELNRRTEYLIQSPIIIASMMNQEITSIDGKTTSNVWDALDVNGNLKPEFRTGKNVQSWERMSSKEFSEFKKKVEGAINLAHGNYSELRGMMLKSNIAGKAMIMFKSWLPMAIYSRFATEQDNILTKQKGFKGRYRSFTTATGSLAGSMAGFLLTGPMFGIPIGFMLGGKLANLNQSNTEMTYAQDLLFSTRMLALKALGMPVNRIAGKQIIKSGSYEKFVSKTFTAQDAKNMNANITELALVAQKLTLVLIVKSLLWDEEDKPEDERRKWHNFFINKLNQMLESTTSYMNPSYMWDAVTDGAFVKFLKDSGKTLMALQDYLYGLDGIASGTHAGESKLYNQSVKTFVPGMFKGVTEVIQGKPLSLGISQLQERQFTDSPFDDWFESDLKTRRKIRQAERARLKKELKRKGYSDRRINKILKSKLPMPKK